MIINNPINKIKKLFSIPKDVKKTNSLYENGGFYLMLCGSYNTPWYVTSIILAVYVPHYFLLTYNIYCLLYIYDEIEMAAECAHFVLVLTNGVFFILVPRFEKKHYDDLNRTLSEGVYEYKGTLDPETAEMAEEIKWRMFRRKLRLSRGMAVFYNTFAFLCLVIFPIAGGKFAKPEKEDDLLRQAVVQLWLPYDTKGWPGWLAITVTEYVIAFNTICVLDGTDITFLCYSEEIIYELKILNLTLRHTESRARYLYSKKYGYEVQTLKGNPRFGSCVRECLRDTIRHHYSIIRCFELLRCAYRKTLVLLMLSGALLLCMSGVIFYSKRFKIGIKITFLLYLCGELTHIFSFCYYGQAIYQESAQVRDSAYEMDWIDCSRDVRGYITMIQIFLNTPLMVKSTGGFFIVNYPSFANVVSSAYTYFNLLSAAIDF